MVGTAVKKLAPKKEWLMLGIILGNLLPDMDALAVAYATLTGGDTHGLHRTWSHSIFTAAWFAVILFLVGFSSQRPRIGNLGLGLGVGMIMHDLLDLLVWFRGVEILWPFYDEVNFWAGFTPPDWWYNKFESTAEFGLFALFLNTTQMATSFPS
jgi:membrane-bound metal-dependent hydrolase YbcI (DUF457 family)